MQLISTGRISAPVSRSVGRRRRRRAAGRQLVGRRALVGAYPGQVSRRRDLLADYGAATYPEIIVDPYDPGRYAGDYPATGNPVFEQDRAQEIGESVMGDSQVVLAGATETITLEPQTDYFRVDKIVIPSNIAANFLIRNITFGTHTIFAQQSGGVPAMMFSEDATDPLIGSYTLKTSQQFAMQVTNQSAMDLTFSVGLKGRHSK